jgi:hypothetical protein
MGPTSTLHIVARCRECQHQATVPVQYYGVVTVVFVDVPHLPIPVSEPAPSPAQPVAMAGARSSARPIRAALLLLGLAAARFAVGAWQGFEDICRHLPPH